MQKSDHRGVAVPYAWFILVILFFGLIATFGMRASFGAYLSPWEKEFSASRSLVTTISMLGFFVFAVSQPFIGKLNDVLGKNIIPTACLFLTGVSLLLTSQASHIWQVFVLFGVTFSIGVAGCSNVIVGAVITNWFVEKRGFALGLATSGMAVGQLIFVPANLFIIEQIGWRSTLATLSIIIMIAVGPLFIFFLRNKPEEKGLKPYGYTDSEKIRPGGDEKRSLPIINVFRSRAFWLLSIPFFICGFTDVGLINTHLVAMAEGKGFAVSDVAFAFSLIAIANIAGTIVTGHLSDHFSRKRQLAVIYSVRLLTYIFLMTLQRPGLFMIFAIIYGAVEMASIAPAQSLTVQIFDGYSIGTILGVVSISHQLGGSIGSWVPGVLYDMTGSYLGVMILSIVMLIGAAVLSLAITEPDVKQLRSSSVIA